MGLKHYFIPKRLYHKPSYIFQSRDFTKAKARLANDSPGPDGRNDTTHRLDYEIGVHPVPQFLLRVHNQYGRNDSNDQFLDFYDYSFYQVTPSVTWEVSKPLLAIVGVKFQRNNYDDRAVRGMAEREDFTAFFGNLFYHVTKQTSVGFHWGSTSKTTAPCPNWSTKAPLSPSASTFTFRSAGLGMKRTSTSIPQEKRLIVYR